MTQPESARVQALTRRVQRLKDIKAVTALMSRYVYYTAAFAFDEAVSTFAHSTDGVTVELADWGVYEGIAGVRTALFEPLAGMIRHHDEGLRRTYPQLDRSNPTAGLMLENALTTPVLQVAGDGQTAKGLWMVMGAQSAFNPGSGAVDATWTWVYFAVDFVREGPGDDGWRIWHLRVAPRWRSDFHRSWAASAADGPVPPPPGLVPPADRPSTSGPTDYALDRTIEYDPRPPEPYATFAETFSY